MDKLRSLVTNKVVFKKGNFLIVQLHGSHLGIVRYVTIMLLMIDFDLSNYSSQ